MSMGQHILLSLGDPADIHRRRQPEKSLVSRCHKRPLVVGLAVLLLIMLLFTYMPYAFARAGEPPKIWINASMDNQSPVHREALRDESPASVLWIDDMRNALGRYIWMHPDLPLGAYLDTLTAVRDAVGRGDRPMVKREMDLYFSMLVMRAQGIGEAAAKELSIAAVRLTPATSYGIAVPASLRR